MSDTALADFFSACAATGDVWKYPSTRPDRPDDITQLPEEHYSVLDQISTAIEYYPAERLKERGKSHLHRGPYGYDPAWLQRYVGLDYFQYELTRFWNVTVCFADLSHDIRPVRTSKSCWPTGVFVSNIKFPECATAPSYTYTPPVEPEDILVPAFSPRPKSRRHFYNPRRAREKFVRSLLESGKRSFCFSIVLDSRDGSKEAKAIPDGRLAYLFFDRAATPEGPPSKGPLVVSMDLGTEAGMARMYSFLWRMVTASTKELGFIE